MLYCLRERICSCSSAVVEVELDAYKCKGIVINSLCGSSPGNLPFELADPMLVVHIVTYLKVNGLSFFY